MGGYDHQWPLEVVDHDNVTHFVANRAGQLIFYESATASHGRPTSFPGREFANVFIHFAPKGWPEEYEVKPGAGEDAKLCTERNEPVHYLPIDSYSSLYK